MSPRTSLSFALLRVLTKNSSARSTDWPQERRWLPPYNIERIGENGMAHRRWAVAGLPRP